MSGILGIGITLRLIKDLSMSFASNTDVELNLYVTGWAVAAAILIAFITVLISAYIPAKRAVKLSAIDAIRQTKDIKIKAKKVKTSKLTYKLFDLKV